MFDLMFYVMILCAIPITMKKQIQATIHRKTNAEPEYPPMAQHSIAQHSKSGFGNWGGSLLPNVSGNNDDGPTEDELNNTKNQLEQGISMKREIKVKLESELEMFMFNYY